MLKLKSVKKFISENYGFFFVIAFVFCTFAVAQACFDIYPFGKAIMASYDQLAQVCPFIEHYFSVLDGTSGLFHTFFAGGGMDAFGILAYCTVSPFTFLFLLGGRGGAIYAVSFVLPLKTACVGLSALWFLKKHFGNIPHYISTVLAILYAFSGYLYVANTYMNWVDLMIYMPVVLSGFIKLSESGSVKRLSIALAACIYTCFSISAFSFFTLFPIGIIYALICKPAGERGKFIAKFCLCFVVAVGASLPILLPALASYTRAGRNTGLFSRLFTADVTSTEHLYEKFTYVLCDAVFIALAIIYFIKNRKTAKAKFLLIALFIALLPCFIDESMLLLNAGSYYSYALRFGFIIDALLFYISAKSLSSAYSEEEVEKNKIKSGITLAAFCLLTGGGTLGIYLLFSHILNGNFKSGEAFYSFFSSFAHSEGGLEATAIVFGIVFLIWIAAQAAAKLKFAGIKDLVAIVAVIALSQSVFYGFAVVKGDRQGGSAENYDKYRTLLSQISEVEDDEYYRLKGYDYYISSDSPLVLRYYANTVFNSMTDAKNLKLTAMFRYGGNGTNSARSNNGTIFSDALFNYRYVVYKNKEKPSSDRAYLEETDIKLGDKDNDYIVYKNTLAFPLAAKVKGESISFEGLSYPMQIDEIYKFLSGGEGCLADMQPVFTENSDGNINVKFKREGYSEYWYWQDFPDDYEPVKVNSDGTTSALQKSTRYFTTNTSQVSLNIGLKEGKLTIADAKKYFHACSLRIEKIERLRDILNANAVKYELKANGIAFPEKIVAEKGEKLYLGYVAIDGYEAKVNGKSRELTANDAGFIVVELDEGENEVEIIYRSPYIKYIVYGLIGALLVIFGVWFIYKRKGEIFKKCERLLSVSGIVLAAGLIAFFFVFPMGVYLYKVVVAII
ncbi:MAG: YfhO family protein [Clostridia bacterium]|nr:YfhO family protein [Clostridia bacterium]